MSQRFTVAREGCDLAGERWPGSAPFVVLLHEGVADLGDLAVTLWRAFGPPDRPSAAANSDPLSFRP